MADGPGKYDDLCTHVRLEAEAQAVILAIFRGNKGSGFSVQGHEHEIQAIPGILRRIADELEKDLAKKSN